jgi:hypothetical protein
VANIRLSGGEEKTCEFAMSVFTPCNVDFVPKTDMVRVKIEPQSGGQGESTPKSGESLLFSRISVAQIGGGEANGAQPGDSPFSGVDFLEGFGDVEGPYKEWELPVVIWGRGGFSRIGVVGTRGGSGMLLLEWRPGEAVQAIDIFHQDALLGHCTVNAPPGAFSRCELRLNSRDAASGELTLRYVGNIETLSNKMNNSALFKQVRFIEKDG